MIFVDAAHGAGGGERLKHAVGPPAVAMLEGLNDLQVQVDVDQVSNLEPAGISVAILLTWEITVNSNICVNKKVCQKEVYYTPTVLNLEKHGLEKENM